MDDRESMMRPGAPGGLPAGDASGPPPLIRARHALREGRLEEAEALGEEVLAAGGDAGPHILAAALSILGEVALRRERPRDALVHLEESCRLAQRPFTGSLIVRSLYRLGEWEEGVARCRGFLRAFPGDSYLRFYEARYHLNRREFSRAEEILGEILAGHPDFEPARGLLLEAKTRAVPPDTRVRELEGLFKIESRRNDPRLRYIQGRNRMEAGDAAGACKEFEAAVTLEPENRFYRCQHAFALKRAGLLSDAIRALRDLFIEEPGDRYVRSSFQSACRATGNMEAWRESIREALRLHPSKRFLWGLLKKAGQK